MTVAYVTALEKESSTAGIVWCVAAFLFGVVLGYILNWAIRHNPKPDAKEVGALVGVGIGAGVVGLVRELIGCPTALAWYLIGVAIGFIAYIVALHFGWDRIAALIKQGQLRGAPLFPWKFYR